jgi:hypothetical protein
VVVVVVVHFEGFYTRLHYRANLTRYNLDRNS